VPRAKYTKPPELPAIENIPRAGFRFRHDQWRILAELLPRRLSCLRAPSEYVDEAAKVPRVPGWTVKTIADLVIQMTEEAISSYLTVRPLIAEGRINPVNNRAAIQRLSEALKPFTRGCVDDETADLIPTSLKPALTAREQELATLRVPSAPRRALMLLCQTIRIIVTNFASANDATMGDRDVLEYVDFALACAAIKHPDLAKHPDRLAALIFPKD